MAERADRTYYEVLGVQANATHRAIRDAHRQMALVLHPDRHANRSSAERSLADRRMKEVNAAWSILSDPVARADYDRRLRLSDGGQSGRRAGSGSATSDEQIDVATRRILTENSDDFEMVPAWQYWLVRRGPLVAILLVAAVIFVVTAYAGSNRGGGTSATVASSQAGRDCVSITTAGRSAVWVPCSSENDGKVVTRVDAALDCPPKTSYVVIDHEFLCVSSDPSVVGSVEGG